MSSSRFPAHLPRVGQVVRIISTTDCAETTILARAAIAGVPVFHFHISSVPLWPPQLVLYCDSRGEGWNILDATSHNQWSVTVKVLDGEEEV